MCVIIHKPAGVSISDEDYTLAHDNNPDGLGLMYRDATGKFVVEHFLDLNIDEVLIHMDRLDAYNVLLHFRFTTVGETVLSQCHPFEVLRKTNKRPSIHMMHNGTFDDVPLITGENDSQAFIKHFLRPVLSVNHTKVYDMAWLKWLDSIAGWSKMAFMDSKGRVSKTGIFTRRKGYTDGTEYFVSNTYSFTKDYRKPIDSPYNSGYPYTDTKDNVYPIDKSYTKDYGADYSVEALHANMIQRMTTPEILTWIKDEPTDVYNILLTNCPIEAQNFANTRSIVGGPNADIYSWLLYYPEEAAELLEDWSYL